MKTNLETFPQPTIEIEQMCYEELYEYLSQIALWVENFKKELINTVDKEYTTYETVALMKEILGE